MTEQIFKQSAGLILYVSLWSGSKKLKEEDFQGMELPPENLVSLGSKRIHNKEALKPIQAVRTKAVSLLEGVAVSLYGGKVWIVPADRLDEVQAELSNLADEFEAEKTRFLQDFYDQQRQWLEQNKQWAQILEPYLDSPETVEKKFGFRWRTFKMTTAHDDNLAEAISGDMTCSLLKEISVLAAETYETLKDRGRATPKNLNRLDRLSSKLQGLSFVEPGISVIEEELRQILDARDADGVLSGQDVFHLTRLLVQLKNPQVLNEVLDAARNGDKYQFAYDTAEAHDEDTATEPATSKPRSKPVHQPRLPDAWF